MTETDIDSFCRTHWLRLCAIARGRGLDEHETQDAVQDVFMRLLQRDQLMAVAELPSVDQQEALLTIRLHREIHHRWRAGQRQRRGGGMTTISLSDDTTSFREPAHHHTAEWHLSVAWVNAVMESAFARLRGELKPAAWEILEPALRKTDDEAEAQPGAVRAALHRARHRLRTILALEVDGAASQRDAASKLFSALEPCWHA